MRRIIKIVTAVLPVIIMAVTILPATVSALKDPGISDCGAALVYCIESGTVLWSREPDKPMYPARLVKLMTALIAAEEYSGRLDEKCEISDSAVNVPYGSIVVGFKDGETVALRELIEVMIHTGANDAAVAVAEAVSGSEEEFVGRMNGRAAELGMTSTHFTNSTGIHDPSMVTTASDMLLLAKYCMNNSDLREICAMIRVTVSRTEKSPARTYGTTNYLLSERVVSGYYYEPANGMICGSTDDAGDCIIASAEIGGLNYISVVMGAGETVKTTSAGKEKTVRNVFGDASALVSWANGNYEFRTVASQATPVCQVDVKLAKSVDKTVLVPSRAVDAYVPRDAVDGKDITYSYELNDDEITAPVKAGQEFGTLTVLYHGEKLGEVPLVVMNNIEQSAGLKAADWLKKLWKKPACRIAVILIAVLAVAYVLVNAVLRSGKKKSGKSGKKKAVRYLTK